MSSFPGSRLEDFLEDLYFEVPTAEQRAFWEPHREGVERALADFDPETQSWRDYRNALADTYLDTQST